MTGQMRRGGGGECNILLAVHRRDAGRRLQCGNYSAAAIAPGHSERQETIIMCLQAIRLLGGGCFMWAAEWMAGIEKEKMEVI